MLSSAISLLFSLPLTHAIPSPGHEPVIGLDIKFSTLSSGGRITQCSNGQWADTRCCVFYDLRDDLQENLFDHDCNDDSHTTLRLAFHDAIGYSESGLGGGGADGSIITYWDIEMTNVANTGIGDIVSDLAPYATKYNVSTGDLIQFAALVGTSNCPGSPNFHFLAGRPPPKGPAPLGGLVPSPADSVDKILARMSDAGFSSEELVALLASHSVARGKHIDQTSSNSPLDSTPGEFDPQFYLETVLKGTDYPGLVPGFGEAQSPLPSEGEVRLQSDSALARDGRTACQWQGYINNQAKMASDFSAAMLKLSLTGQMPFLGSMVDCSAVIPSPHGTTRGAAVYPPGKSEQDVEQNCPTSFPPLMTGQSTSIPSS